MTTELTAYDPGTVLDYSWGYDQTNHEFFKVLSRSGEWVTVAKMTTIEASDGPTSMTGRAIPGIVSDAKPVRRKILRYKDGQIVGIRFASYAACAQPWDGNPKRVSHYA